MKKLFVKNLYNQMNLKKDLYYKSLAIYFKIRNIMIVKIKNHKENNVALSDLNFFYIFEFLTIIKIKLMINNN